MKFSRSTVVFAVIAVILVIAGIAFYVAASSMSAPANTNQASSGTGNQGSGVVASPNGAATSSAFIISTANQNQIIRLSVGQQFVFELSNLKWNFQFDNASLVSPVTNVALPAHAQAMYQVVASGQTVVHGSGAPICNPGQACPQFVVQFTTTIVAQ